MPGNKHHPIAWKLTRMNALVSGAALLLACIAFVGYDLVTFRNAAVNNLSIQAQIIGLNSVSALTFNDPSSANNSLSVLKNAPNIVFAGIYTPDGRLFAEYSRDGSSLVPKLPSIPSGQVETHTLQETKVVMVRSIMLEGQPVGTIYIESDLQKLYDRLERYAGIAAIVLMISLLTVLLISPVFRRSVADPIINLADIARTVSRDKDYSVRASAAGASSEITTLIGSFNEMLEQIQERDRALQKAHDELEQRIEERTAELSVANTELESFSYSVSHDLRAPLRSIDGFSQALLEDCGDKLDANGQKCLQRVRAATQRMSLLIDDLLNLSRVTRSVMQRGELDLSAMARSIAEGLQKEEPGRRVEFVIADGLVAEGDSRLMRVAMENLLGNAWKYTSKHDYARIEFGSEKLNGRPVYFIRDDGAGFDPRYADRLFGAFQRLHGMTEFPGTGVGLATVQRIIHRHGGTVRAEAEVEKGATFYFTL